MLHSVTLKGFLLLLLFSLVIHLPYIDLREFQGEEGRRVMVAVEMLETGEWAVPKIEGEVYLKKPPMFNWLLAGVFWLTGTISEMTARLVSVTAAFLCAWTLSRFWKSIARVEDLWFILPGLIFLTFSVVTGKAIRAEIDVTFTLFVTLSLLSFFYFFEIKKKEWVAWPAAFFFMGIGFLTKGIQAPAFLYAGILPYLVYKKEFRKIFSFPHWVGAGVSLAVFLLWFIPVILKSGLQDVFRTGWEEVAARGETRTESGFLKHFLEFPFLYFLDYFPWLTLLLLWLNKPLKHGDPALKHFTRYGLWILFVSVPVYWILPGAMLRYLLPLAGIVALLISIPVEALIRGRLMEPLWVRRYWQFLSFALIAVGLASPAWGGRVDLFERITPVVLMGVVCTAAVYLAFAKGSFGKRILLLFMILALAKVTWASVYFPYHEQRMSHYRNAAQQINRLVPSDLALYDYRMDNPNLTYYLKRPVMRVNSLNDDRVRERPSAVLVHSSLVSEFKPEQFSRIGEVRVREKTFVVFQKLPSDAPSGS